MQERNKKPGTMAWRADQLEEVPCNSCGGRSTVAICTRPDGMKVVECSRCGLAYLNPRPRPDHVRLLYHADYFAGDGKTEEVGYCEDYTDEKARYHLSKAAEQRIGLIGKHMDLQGKSLLEVGCATGEFCDAASRTCRRVLGIDISEEILQVARERFPESSFRQAEIFDLESTGERFDVICAFEVIEHVLSPSGFLQKARGLLEAGGWLFLSTPNYDFASRLGPGEWRGFTTSWEHLYFLSDRSLTRLAEANGFTRVAAYSAGEGVTPATSPLRRTLVGALRKLRLLRGARRVRDRVSDIGKCRHTEDLGGHNLIGVYRVSDSPHAAGESPVESGR